MLKVLLSNFGAPSLQASSYHFLSNVYLYLGETAPSRHLIDTKTQHGYKMNKMLTRIQNWSSKNILHRLLTKFGIVMMCGKNRVSRKQFLPTETTQCSEIDDVCGTGSNVIREIHFR